MIANGSFLCSSSSRLFSLFLTMLVRTVYPVGPVLFKNTQKLEFHLCIRTWVLYDHLTALSVSTSLMTGFNPLANFSQKSKTHLSSCSVCGIFWLGERSKLVSQRGKKREAAAARGSTGQAGAHPAAPAELRPAAASAGCSSPGKGVGAQVTALRICFRQS